jgi:hypothetical protein
MNTTNIIPAATTLCAAKHLARNNRIGTEVGPAASLCADGHLHCDYLHTGSCQRLGKDASPYLKARRGSPARSVGRGVPAEPENRRAATRSATNGEGVS